MLVELLSRRSGCIRWLDELRLRNDPDFADQWDGNCQPALLEASVFSPRLYVCYRTYRHVRIFPLGSSSSPSTDIEDKGASMLKQVAPFNFVNHLIVIPRLRFDFLPLGPRCTSLP